ncbi:calcium channel protein, partial [Rhizopus stolonifer]
QHFERPEQSIQKSDAKSKYYLLDILYQAANRVVNSRAPESEQVSNNEVFDFKSQEEQPHSPANSKNRYSWLSFASSLDEKSEFDQDSIVLEKKPTNKTTEETPIPSHNIPSSLNYTIPNPLQGHSLCLFGPRNPFRIFVWSLIRKRYVETFILFLMIIHWFLLACVPITSSEQKNIFSGQWTHYPILFIQIIYSIEALCKIIAYGLIIPPRKPTLEKSSFNLNRILKRKPSVANTLKGSYIDPIKSPYDSSHLKYASEYQHAEEEDKDTNTIYVRNHYAYLNSFGNWFDAISIVSHWVDIILMAYEYPNLSLFKSLSAMRPVRLLSILPGTAVILKSLETSWDLLLAVTGLIFFFTILFALIGLISFNGVFSRRCYYTNAENILQLVEPPKYCSGYLNNSVIVGAYNPETQETSYPGYHGYICAAGQTCLEYSGNNPSSGYVNYDTIFTSLLSVYTFVSLELWTDMMYISQDADSTVSALYYCLGVYIVAFVLTFLLFAVITSAFGRVRAENAVSAFTAKKKGYPILRDAEGLDDETMWTFDNAPEDLGKGVTRVKMRWWIVRLVKNRAFFYFGGFLVLLDMIFMCLRSFHASQATLDLIDNAETAFTLIFAIEILLRMIGAASWMSFWSSKTNVFDLFLVICTCILRFYRLFICIPRVRRLLLRALGTGESVFNVMVFLILATALCATVFMQMFGGDFDDIVSKTDTDNRFDTFWESFISLIVIYTSETWTDILYNAMVSQTDSGSIYAAIALSIYFAFGRYIMSGLYIAVVLENFELSDDYIRHYQIKDFIQRHRFKDIDKTETILLKLFRPFYYFNENKHVQVSQLPANLTAPLSKSDLTELLTDLPKNRKNTEVNRQLSWVEKKVLTLFSKIRQRIPFLNKHSSIKAVP